MLTMASKGDGYVTGHLWWTKYLDSYNGLGLSPGIISHSSTHWFMVTRNIGWNGHMYIIIYWIYDEVATNWHK